MSNCFPFINYVYIFILFIFAFICLFRPAIEIVGFSGIFVMQTIYTIFLLLDIFQDKNRSYKVLSIQVPPTQFSQAQDIRIPVWWVLLAGVSLQFTSVILMLITCVFLYKKFKLIKMSRENRWRLQTYKISFVIVTCLLFLLTYAYSTSYEGGNVGNTFSYAYRLMFVGCFIGILGLSSVEVYYANRLSKLIGSSTDG